MLSPEMEQIISTPSRYINPGKPTPGLRTPFHDYLDAKEKASTKKAEVVKPVKVKAVKPAAPPKEAKVNDKKVAAQRLFDANKDKNSGAIARLISAELEITYANAYYYVTRVFKR